MAGALTKRDYEFPYGGRAYKARLRGCSSGVPDPERASAPTGFLMAGALAKRDYGFPCPRASFHLRQPADDIAEARASRHHREDVLLFRHDEIDDDRPVVNPLRLL